MKEAKYKLNAIVFLVTDIDQHERMITGVLEEETGYQYRLSFGDRHSWHFEKELAEIKDYKKI